MTPTMPALQSFSVPASTMMRNIEGCAAGPPYFSIILNVTAEKLPYYDWGCRETPRDFPVILTVTAEKLPYHAYRPRTRMPLAPPEP